MARLVTLKAVNERKLRGLFATNVLVHAWDERSGELGVKKALVDLRMNLRNTHELVMWEFLRGKDQSRDVTAGGPFSTFGRWSFPWAFSWPT